MSRSCSMTFNLHDICCCRKPARARDTSSLLLSDNVCLEYYRMGIDVALCAGGELADSDFSSRLAPCLPDRRRSGLSGHSFGEVQTRRTAKMSGRVSAAFPERPPVMNSGG